MIMRKGVDVMDSKTIEKIKENYKKMEKNYVNQLFFQTTHGSTIGRYREKIWEEMFESIVPKKFVIEQSVFIIDSKERIEKRYTEAIDAASACYLFGIREFNNTPKLLFNDLRLREECRDLKKCFSIDAKTSIDCSGTEPKSNPRTYKAVRKGMEFDGEIEFYHFDEEICQKCKKYLIQNLEKFNDGIYRLGGSKSRGYGKIHVSILEDGREDSEEL